MLRGAALAACCLLLGVSGHALGGAPLGPSVPVLVAAVFIAAGSVAWAGRQRGFGQLLGAAACSQLALHLTLSLSLSPETSMGVHAALDLRMLLGHTVGAALLAAVLARGDATVWALYRALCRFAVPRLTVAPRAPDTCPRIGSARGDGAIMRAGLRLAAATPYRGPPRVAAA